LVVVVVVIVIVILLYFFPGFLLFGNIGSQTKFDFPSQEAKQVANALLWVARILVGGAKKKKKQKEMRRFVVW
jgi:hypothetical protein